MDTIEGASFRVRGFLGDRFLRVWLLLRRRKGRRGRGARCCGDGLTVLSLDSFGKAVEAFITVHAVEGAHPEKP